MAEYLITLTTCDERTVQFFCRTEEDIVSAAERQQIILPRQCRSGFCETCAVVHVHGKYVSNDCDTQLPDKIPSVTPRMLLCSSYPRTDLTLRADYDYQAITFTDQLQVSCTVISAQLVGTQILHLLVQQQSGADKLVSSQMLPGQYFELMIPDKSVQRAYSAANLANDTGYIEFYIHLAETGKFANILRHIEKGQPLLLSGPQGKFTLKDHGLKPRYFIAGGTGLAPILAMLRQMAKFSAPHPSRLFLGLRHIQDLFAQDAISSLQTALPNLTYQCCLSRPDESWTGYHGSVVTAVTEALQHVDTPPDIYICGSVRLVDGILELVQKFAITTDNVHYERFG